MPGLAEDDDEVVTTDASTTIDMDSDNDSVKSDGSNEDDTDDIDIPDNLSDALESRRHVHKELINRLVKSGALSSRRIIRWLLGPDDPKSRSQKLLKNVNACAAVRKNYPDIFEIESTWLFDTGCGHDLISRERIIQYLIHIINVDPIDFNTANGIARAEKSLPMTLKAFSDPWRRSQIFPYILDSTPSVPSVWAPGA